MDHHCRMSHSHAPARPALVAAVAALALTGCATRSAYDVEPVEPLEPHRPAAGKDSTAGSERSAGTEREPAPERPASTGSAPPVPTSAVGQDPTAAVDMVLASYGALVGRIAADPAGAPPPGSPLRVEWDSLVEPGSALSTDVLGRFHQRATVDRMIIVAGADGITFSHRVTRLTSIDDEAVRFEWCGWSPGIVRRIDDGAVVDDSITTSTGTGVMIRRDGDWHLTELEEDERQLLPPGSSDPCAGRPERNGDDTQDQP